MWKWDECKWKRDEKMEKMEICKNKNHWKTTEIVLMGNVFLGTM